MLADVHPGGAEGRTGHVTVEHAQPVGDHRPGPDPGEVGRVLPELAAEVRAGLVHLGQVVAHRLEVPDDERAVAQHVVEQLDVGGAADEPVRPVADAVERVHLVRPHEQLVHEPGHDEDEGERGEHPAVEQRERDPRDLGVQDRVRQAAGTRCDDLRRPRHELRQLDGGRETDRGQQEQVHQLQHRVPEPARRTAAGRRHLRRRRVRGLGRRAVPVLPRRHPLAGLQRRAVPEPPTVTDRGVDVEHRLLRDDHVRAQRDAAEPDPPGLGAVAQQRGVLADHGARPDREQVRARGDARGQHDRTLSDARTEGAQVHQMQRRPREHRHRVRPDQRLHQPEPQVGSAPRGELARLEAPDEQPLGHDRQQRETEEGRRTPGERTQVPVDNAGRGRHPQVPGLQHLRPRHQRGEEQEQLHDTACRMGERAHPRHGRRRRARLPRRRAGGRLQRGERCHRWVLVDLAGRHRCQVGVATDLRAELGQQQRVRAQVVEQVRVGGDLLEPEHLSEQPGQGRLGRSDRGDVLACGSGRPPRRRRREVLAVGLVAGRQRDDVEVLQVGRNHVRRQPVAQDRVDRLRVHGGRVGPQAVVADQLDGARHRFVGVDDGAGDPRHLQQYRLDLGELDPIAADLDLEVDPAVVLDLTVAR